MMNTILRAVVFTITRRVTNDMYSAAKKKKQQPKRQRRKAK